MAKDIEVANVKEHIVKVIKYFRNNHFSKAKFTEGGGTGLVLPSDVRWNTKVQCLERYIKNWCLFLSICENYRDKVNQDIKAKVIIYAIKRNVKDFLARLKPISVALDKMQEDNCNIADCLKLFKLL